MTQSIHHLLTHAVGRDLYNGPLSFTKVYPLQEIDSYLLRIEGGRNPLKILQNTSSLTPIDFHVERNFGQAVLESGRGYQIIMKKEGFPIGDLFENRLHYYLTVEHMRKHEAELYAYKDIFRTLLSLPASAFDSLIDDIKHLSSLAIEADLNKYNILLTSKGLSIIDIYDKHVNFGQNSLEGMALWVGNDFNPPMQDDEFRILKRQFSKKIADAAKRCRLPFDADSVQDYRDENNIVFRPRSVIEGIAPLPITALTQELKQKLREVENHLKIPLER